MFNLIGSKKLAPIYGHAVEAVVPIRNNLWKTNKVQRCTLVPSEILGSRVASMSLIIPLSSTCQRNGMTAVGPEVCVVSAWRLATTAVVSVGMVVRCDTVSVSGIGRIDRIVPMNLTGTRPSERSFTRYLAGPVFNP